ncbi:MAG: hypothetical protein JWP33_2341 [Blastococcus sp.]|nr:hypothetical protein [Blastococcus sp.]
MSALHRVVPGSDPSADRLAAGSRSGAIPIPDSGLLVEALARTNLHPAREDLR